MAGGYGKLKQKAIIYIIVAIVAAIVIYAVAIQPVLKFQKVNVKPEETTLKEVSCDAVVTNPRGLPIVKNGDLVIESANCQQQYVANCGRFGIFADKGTLSLEAAGGLGSATDVSISEGSSQSYTLNWCGSKTTKLFKLKLFNDENALLQTKEVSLP